MTYDFTDMSRDPVAEALGQPYAPPPGQQGGNGHGHAGNGQAGGEGAAPGQAPSGVELPIEVWSASPVLAHVYQAARSRQVSPDVVLHAALAIVASLLNHRSRLWTGKGPSVLSHYVIAVGASGDGKTEALACARELLETLIAQRRLTVEGGLIDLPLGSGEGVTEAFMGSVNIEVPDQPGKFESIRQQVRHNALFHSDEGRMLLAVDSRKGATIMSVLCEMWSGVGTGQTNAEPNRTRQLDAGSYVVGLLLGFQPGTIGDLFADRAGGAPQRFAFAWAPHSSITADEVEWPGALALNTPTMALRIELPAHLRRLVRQHQVARARGEANNGALDGHRMLQVCRTAALLTILHGEYDTVSEGSWNLATALVDTSCRLRDHLATRVDREAAEKARQREESTVRARVRAADQVARAERVTRAADLLVEAVEGADGGELSRGRAKNTLRRYRDVADQAVVVAIADGRLTCETRASTGQRGPREVEVLRLVQHQGEEGDE